MSGPQSALMSAGALPVGASILAIDAPVNFVQGSAEYLRTGSIKAYTTAYAAAIAQAPQQRVFGNDAKTYGTTTGTETRRYYYIGTRYIAWGAGLTWQQGTALNSLGTGISLSPNSVPVKRAAVNGTAYLVVPASGVGVAPWFTADGVTIAAVGGVFTTFPTPKAVCFGNNSWLSLHSLDASATNSRGFIAAANPSGIWTLDTPASVSMTSVAAIAYGAGVFCAVGTSASATAGKIATAVTAGGAWTDRTSASGLTFAASAVVDDIVFTGSRFVIIYNGSSVATSADGITWTPQAFPIDVSTLAPLTGAASWSGGLNTNFELTTDGAGTVVLSPVASSGATRSVFAVSLDHGLTWSVANPYLGKVAHGTGQRTMSYTNGRWIWNHSGNHQSLVDIGTSFATPDFVGQQFQLGAGQYVRIK